MFDPNTGSGGSQEAGALAPAALFAALIIIVDHHIQKKIIKAVNPLVFCVCFYYSICVCHYIKARLLFHNGRTKLRFTTVSRP